MAAETAVAAELAPEATKPVAGLETGPAPEAEPAKPEAAAVDAEAAPAAAPVSGEEAPSEADKEVVAASLEKEIVPPFKQETYVVSELKDFEKKALEEFKLRIEAAIKANEFVVPPPPAPKEEKAEEDKEKEVKAEVEGEGEVPAKTEEKAEEKAVEAAPAAAKEPAVVEVVKAAVAAAAAEVKEKVAAVEAKVEAKVEEAKVEEVAPAAEPAAEAAEKEKEGEAVVAEEKEKEVEVAAVEEPVVVIDEDISLWDVPLLHTKGDERTNVVLLKFLRARDFKVKDAFAMLKKTIIWRKTFNADGLLEEDFGTELDSFAFMSGLDKDQHPVCYNVWGAFKDKKLYQHAFGSPEKIESFIRWRIQVLEKGIKHLNFTPEGPHSMVQITDLRNSVQLTPFGLRSQLKKVVNLLQDNYPELVVRKIFINVPWYFSAPYTLFISPFLSQRTKSKFVVATAGKVTETLFKYISPEQVPVQYGGFKSAGESHFDGLEAAVTELTIKAGAVQTIEIPSPSPKASIHWDVSVVGWDVTYFAEYTPTEGYTTIIEKAKKISATEGPLSASFPAHAPGKVVITIDNSASKKKKLVVYRYDVVTSASETTELAG